MALILIICLAAGAFLAFCALMWWLCTPNKLADRIEAASKATAQAASRRVDALKAQEKAHLETAAALQRATAAENAARDGRAREAKAAEDVATAAKQMSPDELAAFLKQAFSKTEQTSTTDSETKNPDYSRN